MRARCRTTAIALLAFATAALPASAPGQEHGGAHELEPGGLGVVSFPTSCSADVEPLLTRAVAMLHSFWFDQAQRAFEAVAAADPRCAMAQWGIAMTQLGNPFTRAPLPDARLEAGLHAAERAVALAAAQSPREQAYAAAAAALYRDADRLDHLARSEAHEAAMARVREQSPDDVEAAIFHARAVIANAPPDDLTYARQRHAAMILEPIFLQQGQHPGLAHYIIHAYDAPPIAAAGLDAARRYAKIAPAAPHALHMPSHIFTRLGLWAESIETNRRSARAQPDSNAALHAMDYMVYAYLQEGRDREAEGVVRRAVRNEDEFYRGVLEYNFAAMPARLAVERGDWAGATRLTPAADASPHVEAITRFARAIGAARSGQPSVARAEADTLARLVAELTSASEVYWSTVVEAQRLAAEAWVAHSHGRDVEAVALARQAADLEDTVEKHPVTPGPILPARELEGDLLLELGRPGEAQQAYERTLTREPRRARTLFGLARSAEMAGDDDVARQRYGELLELMRDADSDRPEPGRAQQYLARR